MDIAKLSPGMQQYQIIKEKYKDCILFYRLGDFYEVFFEDAVICNRELGLTLTGKKCGLEDKAPMCGVPYHAYDSYAAKLLANGHKVAICEQLTEPNGKELVKRDVVRVITPGTVIDSSMLDESKNSYIMSIYKQKNVVSYAYTDISTGEFYVGYYDGEKSLDYLNDQIIRVKPQEIICNADMWQCKDELMVVKSHSCPDFTQYFEWAYNQNSCQQQILDTYSLVSLKGYDFAVNNANIISIGALLEYIRETQKRDLKHFSMPRFIHDEQYMYIDTNTRRNLELEQTMRDNSKIGSLLWVLDKTQTGGGARMLRKFVNQPLQSIEKINERYDFIISLINNPLVRASLIAEYKNVSDIERIVGKLSYGTISPKECNAIKYTLDCVPRIKDILLNSGNEKLIGLGNQIADFDNLRLKIDSTINNDVPPTMKEGGYIKPGFNKELDEYRRIYQNTKDIIEEMEVRERVETGIKNLKIGYNRVFGYYIEVNKQFGDLVPFRYVRKQTISNNERYITEELKEFETKVLTSEENALKLEANLYAQFKQEILEYCVPLQNLAEILSTLDVFVSLALVALENNYVRPNINTNNVINIKNGRHPVIEKLLKQNEFISNDTLLDDTDNRTMILTGPNMAGKSTYMRQVALITFLAHIGSFVPAESADICIVDRIFTRIGASDDLAVGQSTFMVEMVEVSNILRFATNRSLIILDEVGRGTSTHDGLSIAWAVVDYLCSHLTCKTLFATHYHELMHLESIMSGIKNYCISIKEYGGQLVFLRKIMRGSATRSYGIEVASLAGLPKEVISKAKSLLQELENGNSNLSVPVNSTETKLPTNYKEIMDILSHSDINTISPIVAFDTLARLVELSKKD